MSPEDVKAENLSGLLRQERMASMIDITINGIAYKNVPVLPQPGQAKGTLGLAFGYGRTVENMKVASEAKGFNAFPALALTKWQYVFLYNWNFYKLLVRRFIILSWVEKNLF
jgi:hypothetical protein